MSQEHQYKPGLLERWGLRVLQSLMRSGSADREHHHDFRRQSQRLILLSAALSFVIGFVITAPLVWLELSFPAEPELFSSIFYQKWAAVGGSLAVGSALEIYLLYRLGLYAVYRIAQLAGVHLQEEHPGLITRLPNMLSRVALEIPDPNLKLLQIDSMRMVNKRTLLVRTVVYKLKVMLSNVLSKIVLRKALARSALRAYADYIAAPITALWDAVVMIVVLREVRIRLLSRILAEDILDQVLPHLPQFDRGLRLLLLQTIGNAIVLAQRFHPTLEYLLLRFNHEFQLPFSEQLDDWDLYVAKLSQAPQRDRRLALELLAMACAFDGELSRLERRLLSNLDPESNLCMKVDALTRPIRSGDLQAARQLCRLPL
ncbi:MAG: hypothetical protein K1X75_15670 [Leptospirales bacterium]|nr:hypothetical protein [Leptospirales bacterium]